MLNGEAVQRAVGNLDALPGEQDLHLAQPKPSLFAGARLVVETTPSQQGILSPINVDVTVRDASGEPVPGLEVTWLAPHGRVGEWYFCLPLRAPGIPLSILAAEGGRPLRLEKDNKWHGFRSNRRTEYRTVHDKYACFRVGHRSVRAQSTDGHNPLLA